MINPQNPYNLPDRVVVKNFNQGQSLSPQNKAVISLQNKRTREKDQQRDRDRSQQYGIGTGTGMRQLSNKGIRLDSTSFKDGNNNNTHQQQQQPMLHHVSSSPNLSSSIVNSLSNVTSSKYIPVSSAKENVNSNGNNGNCNNSYSNNGNGSNGNSYLNNNFIVKRQQYQSNNNENVAQSPSSSSHYMHMAQNYQQQQQHSQQQHNQQQQFQRFTKNHSINAKIMQGSRCGQNNEQTPILTLNQDNRIKYINDKLIYMNQQLIAHQKALNRLNTINGNKNKGIRDFQTMSGEISPTLSSSGHSPHLNQQQQQRKISSASYSAGFSVIGFKAETGIASTSPSNSTEGDTNNNNAAVMSVLEQVTNDIKLIKQELALGQHTGKDSEERCLPSLQKQKSSSSFSSALQDRIIQENKEISKLSQIVQGFKAYTNDKFNKLERPFHFNQNAINKVHERIDSAESSIEKANQQISLVVSKVMSLVNEKLAKVIEGNQSIFSSMLEKSQQKLQKYADQKITVTNEILSKKNLECKLISSQLKISGFKSVQKSIAIRHQSNIKTVQTNERNSNIKSANSNQIQICLSECIYHIDRQGFLLDENKNYITDQNDKLLKLGENQIHKLVGANLFDSQQKFD